eukprot:gene25991-11681_t
MLAARSSVWSLSSNKPGLKGVAQRPVCISVRARNVPKVLTARAMTSDEVYKVVKLAEQGGTISIGDTNTSGRNDSLIGSILVSASAVFLGLCIVYASGVSPPDLSALPSISSFTAAPEVTAEIPALQPALPLAPASTAAAPIVVAPPVVKAVTIPVAPAAPAPAPELNATPTFTEEELGYAQIAKSPTRSLAAPFVNPFSKQANTPKAALPAYPDCLVNMC